MRLFLDTSSLFMKYVAEPGSEALESLLGRAAEIAVSPVTWIEMNAVIFRRLRSRDLSASQAAWLRTEAQKDFSYFLQGVWNSNLEEQALALMRQYPLKSLDAIQLASGILSKADLFVTSDRRLFRAAKALLGSARWIG